jgi:hypothetical protein
MVAESFQAKIKSSNWKITYFLTIVDLPQKGLESFASGKNLEDCWSTGEKFKQVSRPSFSTPCR